MTIPDANYARDLSEKNKDINITSFKNRELREIGHKISTTIRNGEKSICYYFNTGNTVLDWIDICAVFEQIKEELQKKGYTVKLNYRDINISW